MDRPSDKDQESQEGPTQPVVQRRPYDPPSVQVWGTVEDFTTGGAGSIADVIGMMQNMV